MAVFLALLATVIQKGPALRVKEAQNKILGNKPSNIFNLKVPSRDLSDKLFWDEFEQRSSTKLPRSGEVHGRTS